MKLPHDYPGGSFWYAILNFFGLNWRRVKPLDWSKFRRNKKDGRN
jgi:hypothetical protein